VFWVYEDPITPAEVMKKFEETFNCPVIEGYSLSKQLVDRLSIHPTNVAGRPRETRVVVQESGNVGGLAALLMQTIL
jgi:hypothetical protein